MGFFDMDESWYNRHNMFLRKGSLICNYVIDKIDNDEMFGQAIRRFCRYLTINPLSTKSVDLAGNEIIQGDLKDSLQIQSTEGSPNGFNQIDDVSADKISNQCLFNGSFNQEIKRMEQCYIFVHNYQNRPRGNDMGDIYIRIDIIIPDKYDNVYDPSFDLYIKRGDALCILIDDMLNQNEIKDERYKELIGDVKFVLKDNGKERLTKTSDGVVYSLIYQISMSSARVMNGNL